MSSSKQLWKGPYTKPAIIIVNKNKEGCDGKEFNCNHGQISDKRIMTKITFDYHLID